MFFSLMLPNLFFQNFDLVRNGMVNLAKQIENAKFFGVHAVVAVNRFPYVLSCFRRSAFSYGFSLIYTRGNKENDPLFYR